MFIEAKDDGIGGDNWSYKSSEAAVKSSPPTPNFLQAGCHFCHTLGKVIKILAVAFSWVTGRHPEYSAEAIPVIHLGEDSKIWNRSRKVSKQVKQKVVVTMFAA